MVLNDNRNMDKRLNYKHPEIAEKYKQGSNATDLATEYGLTIRQIQRICAKFGVSRTISESYRLAIKEGRMVYYKRPEHLKIKRKRLDDKQRYHILGRDKSTCKMCGRKARDGERMEVDHIDNDFNNNVDSNLQILCQACNRGKTYNSPQWKQAWEDQRKWHKEAKEMRLNKKGYHEHNQ
jgi:5-methylcytosine-specific restriction endonuclease McrA